MIAKFLAPKAVLGLMTLRIIPISPSDKGTRIRSTALGTFTSSRMMAQVEEPLMPIFFSSAPIVTPSLVRSTMKPVNALLKK